MKIKDMQVGEIYEKKHPKEKGVGPPEAVMVVSLDPHARGQHRKTFYLPVPTVPHRGAGIAVLKMSKDEIPKLRHMNPETRVATLALRNKLQPLEFCMTSAIVKPWWERQDLIDQRKAKEDQSRLARQALMDYRLKQVYEYAQKVREAGFTVKDATYREGNVYVLVPAGELIKWEAPDPLD